MMDKINSMYFQLEMDRPLNLDDVNLISPGQYTAKFHDGNECSFDFSASEKSLISGNDGLIYVCLHDIDYEMNDMEKVRHLTIDDIRSGSFDFSEFFIYIDEDHDVIPKKISFLEFTSSDGKVFEASNELIESANRILDAERCEKLLLRECPGHENRYSTFIAENASFEKLSDGRAAEYGKDFSVSYSVQSFEDDENYISVDPFNMNVGDKASIDLSAGMLDKTEFEAVINKLVNQSGKNIKKMSAAKNRER